MTLDTLVKETHTMNLTPDRQGYLGDLRSESIPQLKELLERQEKILLKRKFIESLPDKGEKIGAFAVYLKQLIEEKSGGSSSSAACSDLMEVIPNVHQKSLIQENVSAHDFRDIVSDKDTFDVRAELQSENSNTVADISETAMLDSSSSLALSLEKMSLGGNIESNLADTGHFINSYERVIKNAEAQSSNKKPKFLPHRTLLDDHIPPSPYASVTKPPKTERKEESAVKLPCYKFQKSKLISLEESVKLLEEQRALNEELVTQQAARKLADQLVPKMDSYSPSSTDMPYRETAVADQDSDDDEDKDDDDDDDVTSQNGEY